MGGQPFFLKAKEAEVSLQHGDSPRQNQRFEKKWVMTVQERESKEKADLWEIWREAKTYILMF